MAKCVLQVGDKIGCWKIIEKLGMNKYGGMRWRVRCECGKIKIKISGHILASAKSGFACGCKKYTGFKDITGKYWKDILQKARMRGFEIHICIEDAWKKFE